MSLLVGRAGSAKLLALVAPAGDKPHVGDVRPVRALKRIKAKGAKGWPPKPAHGHLLDEARTEKPGPGKFAFGVKVTLLIILFLPFDHFQGELFSGLFGSAFIWAPKLLPQHVYAIPDILKLKIRKP